MCCNYNVIPLRKSFKIDINKHLESRLRFYFDLKKKIKNPYAIYFLISRVRHFLACDDGNNDSS